MININTNSPKQDIAHYAMQYIILYLWYNTTQSFMEDSTLFAINSSIFMIKYNIEPWIRLDIVYDIMQCKSFCKTMHHLRYDAIHVLAQGFALFIVKIEDNEFLKL